MSYAVDMVSLHLNHRDLAESLASFSGVSDILAWMQRAGLTRTKVDMIAMDEFEYDFLIQLEANSWLAFGIT